MIAGRYPLALLAPCAVLAIVGAGCAASSSTAAQGQRDAGSADASNGTGGATAGGTGGSGTGGRTGTGGAAAGTGGVTGSGGSTGAGGAAVGCFVTLAVVSPTSYPNLEAGPNAVVRIQASVSGGRMATWIWTVLFKNMTTIPTVLPTLDPAIVEFPIKDAGQYDVTARATAGVSCSATLHIPVNPACPTCFTFRVTPPPSTVLAIPSQERRIDIASLTTVIKLDAGTRISVAPQAIADGRFIAIAAYVRVSNSESGVAIEGYTARGPVNVVLLPPLMAYDVLVVPDEALAPQRLNASFLQLSGVTIDPGLLVTGVARDGNGAPVVGAHVLLRNGTLPSTVGVSDASGQFSLLARPGISSAVIAPPDTSGLSEAHIAASPGVALDSNIGTLDLSMTWAALSRGALTVVAKTTDGNGPAVGARVRIESDTELPSVGTLLAQAPGAATAMLPATGAIRIDRDVDANGVAAFPRVPTGTYKVTVVPSATMPEAALTTTLVTLTAAGFTGTVPLFRPVTLRGTLLRPLGTGALGPAAGAKGVRVIARDQSTGIVAEVASVNTGGDGSYALTVAPGRTYQLVADPPPGLDLARTVLDSVQVGPSDQAAPTFTVSRGAPFSGTVQSGTLPIGGAVVQVFCLGSSGCLDPKSPVAEAVTQADGTFTVTLPATIP